MDVESNISNSCSGVSGLGYRIILRTEVRNQMPDYCERIQEFAKRSRGFTLVEMILVVVIIGLLAVLVLPRITGVSEDTRKAAAMAQVSNCSGGLGTFEMTCGRFPTTSEGLNALVKRPSGLPAVIKWKECLEATQVPLDPWGREYVYRCPGTVNPRKYDLFSVGPDGKPDTEDDIGNTKKR